MSYLVKVEEGCWGATQASGQGCRLSRANVSHTMGAFPSQSVVLLGTSSPLKAPEQHQHLKEQLANKISQVEELQNTLTTRAS